MRQAGYPDDIMALAREALSGLLGLGIDIPRGDQPKALRVIAAAINAERTSIQNDVVAAVVNESEACRAAVFRALRKVSGQ